MDKKHPTNQIRAVAVKKKQEEQKDPTATNPGNEKPAQAHRARNGLNNYYFPNAIESTVEIHYSTTETLRP